MKPRKERRRMLAKKVALKLSNLQYSSFEEIARNGEVNQLVRRLRANNKEVFVRKLIEDAISINIPESKKRRIMNIVLRKEKVHIKCGIQLNKLTVF